MALKLWQWYRTQPPRDTGFGPYLWQYGYCRFALFFTLLMEVIVRPLLRRRFPFTDPLEALWQFTAFGLVFGALMWLSIVRSGGNRGNH